MRWWMLCLGSLVTFRREKDAFRRVFGTPKMDSRLVQDGWEVPSELKILIAEVPQASLVLLRALPGLLLASQVANGCNVSVFRQFYGISCVFRHFYRVWWCFQAVL